MPARYPEEPFSLLFLGDGAKFNLDQKSTKAITQAGLVSGAVFSDLDGDGLPELILACEWGPMRVFRREQGKWRDLTRELGLEKYLGWWNGVATGDFDGDGRLDIVASNWGRNTKYQGHREEPLRIAYGDWSGRGTVDAFETYYDSTMKKSVPWCSFASARAIPWVADQFATHESFGAAGINDILAERLNSAKIMQANWLETTVFMNRGDHFEARVLPAEAQFAPAFGISVGDLDGDGHEDIFLSQNFFAVDGDTSRYDAGCGLWLAGDGKGNFRAVGGEMSGVKIYGEQRGCALCDYDGDGRLDLVVTQNGGETKLYHNTMARPGLRVRLTGPAGNPKGIGASVRLAMGGKLGPAREIHAGSGYWSQESVVQVLATPEVPTEITVRWPGGKTVTAKVPQGAREVAIDTAGRLKMVR
jgi:hypothetical protein